MGDVFWMKHKPLWGPRVMLTTSHEAPGFQSTQVN